MTTALDQFSLMKPAQKKVFFQEILMKAEAEFERSKQSRSGKTQGYAFLWISLYGKDPITKAFRTFLKNNQSRRIIDNYRDSKYAWYFGSQNDLGFYDGLQAMAKYLNEQGICCVTGDAWD